jgi:hypothetical protein
VGGAAVLMVLAIAAPVGVRAQTLQPVYVQYDGYVRNKDGGFTLAFGYDNLNGVDVTIPPGDANGFAPAPGDRHQPVLFRKGRHRFACVLVVDESFDGRLLWTVKFAGKSNTTTLKGLDPLYELELKSEKRVLTGLDVAAVPKNVCINRAPVIQIAPSLLEAPSPSTSAVELAARVGQELTINAQIEDDGLPRGGKVTSNWRKNSGPGEVTFSEVSTGPTRVKFAAPGTYELELSATDGERSSRLKVTVVVAAR